jgi:glycosyltransferase involved in cell wall biosynthesis
LRTTERELVALCDVVFTNCSALANAFAPTNPNSHVFPFGVNLDAFPLEEVTTRAANADAAPEDMRAKDSDADDDDDARLLPKPIIGYVGGMHRHVDFDLIREMAKARPSWSWVCVGALQADTTGLAELPNVHMVGQKRHDELVDYIRLFDVCIVPYVNSIYTETVVPTKINEYLAMGKPVVSTDLPTVCEFNEEHRVLITAPARAEDFLRAIESALSLPKDQATIRHRRRVAELGNWHTRLESMSRLIEESLGIKADAPAEEVARVAASTR